MTVLGAETGASFSGGVHKRRWSSASSKSRFDGVKMSSSSSDEEFVLLENEAMNTQWINGEQFT